jgi:hypothetical protein
MIPCVVNASSILVYLVDSTIMLGLAFTLWFFWPLVLSPCNLFCKPYFFFLCLKDGGFFYPCHPSQGN